MDDSKKRVPKARRGTDQPRRGSSVRFEIVAIFVIVVLAIFNAVRVLI
jgi:hypothetical protein